MSNGFLFKTYIEVTLEDQKEITPNKKWNYYLLLFYFLV